MATAFIVPLPLTLSIDVGTLAFDYIRRKFSGAESKLEQKIFEESPKGVTVVITAHNRTATIEDSVRHAFAQTYPIQNMYISDSGLDNTREVIATLREEFPNLHYWSREGVTGKADKFNFLVRDPNVELADLVYLKDSTARMEPGVIERLVEEFADEKVAAATSFGYATAPDSKAAMLFHYGKEWVNRLGRFRKNAQQIRRAMYVVCGASFMVRSSVLKEIAIPTGTKTEDTAYTWKLQEAGYKVSAAQDAEIASKDVGSLKSQLRQSYRWYTGSWQNLWLHSRDLFGFSSQAKSLAYTTILPGFLEATAYAATIAGLPALYAVSPELGNYFLIGDTVLSLAAPLISTPLNGKARETPKEFWNTVTHYPEITAYKVLASALWIASGTKVAYDKMTGKSRNWIGTWSSLK